MFGRTYETGITNCFVRNVDIDIKNSASIKGIGGLQGGDNGSGGNIRYSYTTGTIRTNNVNVGGISGNGYSHITSSYSTVNIISESSYFAGIVGNSNNSMSNLENVFYGGNLLTTSLDSNFRKIGNGGATAFENQYALKDSLINGVSSENTYTGYGETLVMKRDINKEKYIEMFNKRVSVLLVCFHPNIRGRILITNPSDKPTFTEKECELVSGYPNKESDQDTYEALMTPERKEIEYWVRSNKVPPFVTECGINWEELVKNYKEMLEKENDIVFQEENAKYLKALTELTDDDYKAFDEDDEIPKSLLEIVTLNNDMHFYFKKLPNMKPTTGGYIFDDLAYDYYRSFEKSELEFEKLDTYAEEN